MTPLLQQTVERLYKAFGDVPKPAFVDGCPCCLEEQQIGTLLSKPLRNLAPEDLTHYAASALLTVGSAEDYVYFLPRILEILILQPDWWPSPEVVARAILYADFPSWPDSHHRAVLGYFDDIITDLLGKAEVGHPLDTWLCALGRLQVDLAPTLARIAAHPPRLIELYEENSQPLVKGRLGNAFWDDSSMAEQKQVVEWFRSAGTQRLIEWQYSLG